MSSEDIESFTEPATAEPPEHACRQPADDERLWSAVRIAADCVVRATSAAARAEKSARTNRGWTITWAVLLVLNAALTATRLLLL